MRLSTRAALVVAAAFATATIANVLLLQFVVQPIFIALDETHAGEDHKRARDAIKADLQSLAQKAQDWSHWDDPYAYALGKAPDFPKLNMQPSQIENMGASAAVITTPDFRVLFQVNAVEDARGTASPMTLFLSVYLPIGLRSPADGIDFNAKAFPIQIGGKLYLSAVAPIVTSEGKGPISGYIVFLRVVDPAYVTELSNRTEVNLQFRPTSKGTPGRQTAEGVLTTNSFMTDHAEARALEIVTVTERAVKHLGETVLLWTSMGLSVIGLIATVLAAGAINILLVAPITRIAAHMDALGKSGDLTVKLDSDRKDEVGHLAIRLNRMASDLDTTRKQMIDQTHASGMADMAADVLHNVRNAMNPMTVGVWMLQKHVSTPVPANLGKAVAELAQDGVPADRRQKLAKFAAASIDEILAQRDKVAEGFSDFVKTAHHIEDVLRDFDAASRGPRRMEAVNISEVAAAARDLIAASLPASPQIEIDLAADLVKMPMVNGSRVVLQQILGNLLKNASESIQKSGASRGNIAISGAVMSDNGEERVCLRISDTGVGIAPDKLEKIFARGETSNAGANRGLGLHWCANSLVALGGRIFATSDGSGTGATLHLVLCIQANTKEKAA